MNPQQISHLRKLMYHAKKGDLCTTCGRMGVNPLLHIAEPWRCSPPGGRPPLGGWPEPHKDDL
jgi:hypothetical protein